MLFIRGSLFPAQNEACPDVPVRAMCVTVPPGE
jgi:hypothetical protein